MTEESPSADDQPDVLFIVGAWEGESKRYRVFNLTDAIEARGFTCEVVDFYDMSAVLRRALKPRIAIFFRAPFDTAAGVVAILHHFRSNRVITVFDIDDLVFEPDLVHCIRDLPSPGSSDRFDYEWGVRGYRAMMFACDRVTVSTSFLAERAARLGRHVRVVRNSVNAGQLAHAAALPARSSARESIRICYLSGSRTHARDFQECAPALQALMAEHPTLIFRLVGMLDLDESWHPFAERIERRGFVDHLTMLSVLNECDINIAPLEECNPFCEAKSELKFFEAGLVGVPTLASRTETYSRAIADGMTGLLASGDEEWHAKLGRLVTNSDLRHSLGIAARAVAMRDFHSDAAAREALVAYGLIGSQPDFERTKEPLHVAIMFSSAEIDGEHLALRLARSLDAIGHIVRLYVAGGDPAAAKLRRVANEGGHLFEGAITTIRPESCSADIIFGADCTATDLAGAMATAGDRVVRIVDQFEPDLLPLGFSNLSAMESYKRGGLAVSATPTLALRLKLEFGIRSLTICPSGMQCRTAAERRAIGSINRVIFDASCDQPHRCLEFAQPVLQLLRARIPHLDICVLGSGLPADDVLSFDGTILDVPSMPEDRAAIFGAASVGIALSVTSASATAYEMIAAGLPVVDLAMPHRELDYGGSGDVAVLVEPRSEAIAEAVERLLINENERRVRARRGIELASTWPSMESWARDIEADLRHLLSNGEPLRNDA